MSYSSLIFSIEAISIKVNSTFVFILIIATLLAIYTPVHLYPAITSAPGLYLGLYNSPHTFSEVFSSVFMRRFDLGLISWPSHLLSNMSSPFIGGRILFHMGDLKVAPRFSTTNHIEKESCGTFLAILHLNFYVWSFYVFLLDTSTYTNSLWCLRLSS